MSCKSAIYTANTTAVAVAVNGIIPLGEVIRRFGANLSLSGNTITARGRGYYDANVSVSAEATAAGDVTVSLLADGIPVPGATATESAAAAGDIVNLTFPGMIRLLCECDSSNLALQLTDGAATMQNVAVLIEEV